MTKMWHPAHLIPRRVRDELAKRGATVRRVRDARSQLRLSVTKDDVKNGTPGDPLGCAGAVGLCRQTGVKAAVLRARMAYIVYANGSAVRYYVPVTVRQQLVLFDLSGNFTPGVYYLNPPTPTQQLGADKRRKRATGPKTATRPNKTRVMRNVTAGIRW
jgi:hypothetical protein